MVGDVDIQFALFLQSSKGEIAAADDAVLLLDGVGAEEEIELGVQGMAKEHLHADFAGLELFYKAPQAGFVVVGGGTKLELLTEFHDESPLEA